MPNRRGRLFGVADADLPRFRLRRLGRLTSVGQDAALPAVQQEVGHARGKEMFAADIQGVAFSDAAEIDSHAGFAELDRVSFGIQLDEVSADE